MIDKINQRYGTKNILLGVEGVENQKWKTKSGQRTPNYLTDINEIMTIKI
jgi:umuC protein